MYTLFLLAALYLHLLDDIVLLLLLLALVPGDGPPDLLVVAVVTHEGAAAGHLAGLAGKEEEGERVVECEMNVKKVRSRSFVVPQGAMFQTQLFVPGNACRS